MKKLAEQIEIINVEQFISTNVYEWSQFESSKQKNTIENLITVYNDLIEKNETDLSLKVDLERKH